MGYSTETRHLNQFLNQLYERFNNSTYLESDPIQFAHFYKNPLDQEVVGIVSALLAYGNAIQIRKSVSVVLERLSKISPYPSQAIQDLSISQIEEVLGNFYYRFNKASDIACLFYLIAKSQKIYGSVGAHFNQYVNDSSQSIETPLTHFLNDWESWARPCNPKKSFFYLLSNPKNKSACKRWCMLLKWFIRKDQIDIGIWGIKSHLIMDSKLKPLQLVMPLDTHVVRISRYIGLTRRLATDWKTSLEVTSSLKLIEPCDPTRFDFALSRLGILKLCKKKYEAKICPQCDLFKVCSLAQKS